MSDSWARKNKNYKHHKMGLFLYFCLELGTEKNVYIGDTSKNCTWRRTIDSCLYLSTHIDFPTCTTKTKKICILIPFEPCAFFCLAGQLFAFGLSPFLLCFALLCFAC